MATKTNTNGNVSIVKKIRHENDTLSSIILAVYRLHSEMQDKDARAICDALNITAATTKNRAARNELRLAIIKRLPIIIDGAESVTPAALKKASKDSGVFFAVKTDWAAAIIAAANNKPDESGNYKQIKVSLNAVEWIKDGNNETNNVNRDATKVYCYDKAGNDVTAANTAFVNSYIYEVEAKRVANKAGKAKRDEVFAEQIKIMNGDK